MAKTILPYGKQHRAFKGQLYPNAYQRQYLLRCIGSSRYIYNALLHLMQYRYYFHNSNQEALTALKPRPDLQPLYWLMELQSYQDEYAAKPYTVGPNQAFLSYLVSCLKSHENKAWLLEVPRTVLTYAVKALVSAFQGFYRLVKLKQHIGPNGLIGFPSYKNKHSRQSIRLQASEVEIASYGPSFKKHELRLPQCRTLTQPLGLIKVKGLRKLQGRLLSIAISASKSGEWSFSVLTEAEQRIRQTGFGTIGLDLSAQRAEVAYAYDGYQHFQLSQLESLPKAIPIIEARIKHLQQLLARNTKGSYRWKAYKARIAKQHQKLKNLYEGYYHRLANWLIQTYDSVIIEDLDAKGLLTKSHSSLAKLIQDSRFSVFKLILQYKLQETVAGKLGIADRFYPSSQICSSCGYRPLVKLPLHVRHWQCEACQAEHHRDYNAASNLYSLKEQLDAIPLGQHLALLA